jgi:putative oxidoreductase
MLSEELINQPATVSKRDLVVELICGLLIFLFCYTALSKLLNLEKFVRDMKSQPLPDVVSGSLVVLLPFSEVLISGLLFFKKTRLRGLLLSLILMISFIIYIVTVLTGGFDKVPCSCGGVIEWLNWEEHLLLNLFFVLLIMFALMLETGSKYIPSTINKILSR